MKKNFNKEVVYQIYPKSFLDTNSDGFGDIQGIIKKLDYIKELGVDYIWLSPINQSPQYDNGYDISDYYEIDPIFGSKDDYKQLITEAAERDMKIMLDLVLNHVSSESAWFKAAEEGDPKYHDYFIWRDEPNELMSVFGGPAWTYSEKAGKYYFHLFDSHQPDLNWENPVVREEIYKMVNYWIDFGVRGFRLDVIDLIGKEPEKYITAKGPKFYEYLAELHQKTFKDKILTVGECWGSSLEESHKICDHDGLTEIFHLTERTLNDGNDKWDMKKLDLKKLVEVIVKWHNDYDGFQTKVMNNHDLPRLVSIWLDDENYRYESVTLLGALYAFFAGTYYVYQGDEIGLVNDNRVKIEDYNDVETINIYNKLLAEGNLTSEEIIKKIKPVSRDNARTPMQWTPEKFGGFSDVEPWLSLNYRAKEINVQNDLMAEKSVYHYFQKLLKFRKQNYESVVVERITQADVIDQYIEIERQSYIMYFNFSKKSYDIDQTNKVLWSNYEQPSEHLRPYEVKILYK